MTGPDPAAHAEATSPVSPEPAGPTIVAVALKGLCPRCGAPTLFRGIVAFAHCCPRCGLDFDAFDLGDGPAAFLTMIVGAIVVALVVWVQVAIAPPWWVHLLFWPLLTVALVLGSLRIAKAALIAAEYRNRAGEGRLK